MYIVYACVIYVYIYLSIKFAIMSDIIDSKYYKNYSKLNY